MKTRNYILLSVAMLAAVLAGCQKKSAEPKANAEEAAVEKTFYGSTTNGEKTTLASDYNTLWTAGDKIKVYANGGTGSDFTLTNGAGTSYGEFSGSTAATGPYVAVYPSTAAQSVSSTTATITLPATQSITAAGTFADGTVPMVAYSTTDFLSFKNVGSLLRLKLQMKSGSATLSKIELKGNDNENLAGTYTVNANSTQPKATYSSNGSTTLTVNCSNITLNSTTPTTLYIFVPAGVFTKGFTATLSDNVKKLKAEITTSKDLTTEVAKGQIFSANVTFPTTGEAYNKQLGSNVKWVQLWAGGPKWAVFNVGCNATEPYGSYFAWGGSTNKGYTDYYTGNKNIQYDPSYDTARKIWGDNWQMPTSDDLVKLIDPTYCNAVWTTNYSYQGGKWNGLLVTGKTTGYTSNTVFLPATGYYNYSSGFIGQGVTGEYWSSNPNISDGTKACKLHFRVDKQTLDDETNPFRYLSFTVRPILHE